MSARQHPACSPLSHAGYLPCPECGAPAYAAEATWLDECRILATFAPGCDHVSAETLVVGAAEER